MPDTVTRDQLINAGATLRRILLDEDARNGHDVERVRAADWQIAPHWAAAHALRPVDAPYPGIRRWTSQGRPYARTECGRGVALIGATVDASGDWCPRCVNALLAATCDH